MKKIGTITFAVCLTFFYFFSFIGSLTQANADNTPPLFPGVEVVPTIKQSPYLNTGAPRMTIEHYYSIFQRPFSFFKSKNIRSSTWYYTDYKCQNDSGIEKIIGQVVKHTALVNVVTRQIQTADLEILTPFRDVAYCVPDTCGDAPKAEAPIINSIEQIDNYRTDVVYGDSYCQLLIANGGQCFTDSDCRSNHCNSFRKCDAIDLVPGAEKTNADPVDDYFRGPYLPPEIGNDDIPLISPEPGTPSEVPISPSEPLSCDNLSCGDGQTCMTDIWGAYCADKLIAGMYCNSTSQCAGNLQCSTSTSTCTSDEVLPPASSENNESNSNSAFCNASESYCTGDSQEPCQCNSGKKCDSESVSFCQEYL